MKPTIESEHGRALARGAAAAADNTETRATEEPSTPVPEGHGSASDARDLSAVQARVDAILARIDGERERLGPGPHLDIDDRL